MLRPDDYVKGQLVTLCWRETLEYGGHLGALMVMGCLMNRVRCGWGSHLEMIEKAPTFSASFEELNSKMLPSIWQPAFTRLLHEVESQYDGSGVDYSKGALYWADLRRIDREWFRTNILDRPDVHPRVADMNSLTLFK